MNFFWIHQNLFKYWLEVRTLCPGWPCTISIGEEQRSFYCFFLLLISTLLLQLSSHSVVARGSNSWVMQIWHTNLQNVNKAAYTVQTFFGTYFPNICFLNQDFCALVSGLKVHTLLVMSVYKKINPNFKTLLSYWLIFFHMYIIDINFRFLYWSNQSSLICYYH